MPRSTTESAPATLAYVGLGANLGEPDATLRAAVRALAALPDSAVLACSSFYRSAPIDATGPDYLNAVLRLETRLAPHALLAALQRIEAQAGRRRAAANAARTLDLDIIAMGGLVRAGPDPVLPHPRAHLRAFVLAPMAEVAPDWVHPLLGRRAAAMLAELSGQRIDAI